MNLEAFLEDLEAQGYFESTNTNDLSISKESSKSILVIREGYPSIALALPLLGKDFIAGFQNRITRSSWLLIPNYVCLQTLDNGTELQRTSQNIKRVIQAHLIGVAVRISTSSDNPEQSGYFIRVIGNLVEFVDFDANSFWIPLTRINYVVVDKLSIKKQDSAT